MHDAEQRRQRQEQQRREAAEQRRIQEQRDAEELSRKQALLERRTAHKMKLNRTIQTNFQGTRTILIANPKGGARKTTTTYILGAMIGSTRGGSTIAWDANETMGTLGERARDDRHHRTVVDLLEDGAQHFLDIDSARVGILDAYVRNQGDCHFDVLASDENANRQDQWTPRRIPQGPRHPQSLLPDDPGRHRQQYSSRTSPKHRSTPTSS